MERNSSWINFAALSGVSGSLFLLYHAQRTFNLFSPQSFWKRASNLLNTPFGKGSFLTSSFIPSIFQPTRPQTRSFGDDTAFLTKDKAFRNVGSSIRFFFDNGVFVQPHSAKVHKGGEDAYFVLPHAIGVADGVGGWADVGVDPALYARSLMKGAEVSARKGTLDPVEILNDGYTQSVGITGSSTGCVLVIDGNTLKAANLGDSGFMIVRDEEILMKTKEQQHAFNFPFQLGSESNDKPSHADRYEVELNSGDLIILGTDGLFDNLFVSEILQLCNKGSSSSSQDIANIIGTACHISSRDNRRNTPFSSGARKLGAYLYGGKEDDITIVVARVDDEKNRKLNKL